MLKRNREPIVHRGTFVFARVYFIWIAIILINCRRYKVMGMAKLMSFSPTYRVNLSPNDNYAFYSSPWIYVLTNWINCIEVNVEKILTARITNQIMNIRGNRLSSLHSQVHGVPSISMEPRIFSQSTIISYAHYLNDFRHCLVIFSGWFRYTYVLVP